MDIIKFYLSVFVIYNLFINENTFVYAAGSTYVGAVVSLATLNASQPESDPNNVRKMIEKNVKVYSDFIKEAGTKKVDVLVFSEATFNYWGMWYKPLYDEFGLTLPEPKDNIPCGSKYPKVIEKVCDAIRKAKIYVMMNVVEKINCKDFASFCPEPKRKFNFFSVNLVFDRTGKIIQRYRKINPFSEIMVDIPVPKDRHLAYFESDFGVKFGHFVCFDIIFPLPGIDLVKKKKIKNFLFDTMWYSKTPYMLAPQVQMGWAYSLNVNLLAACGIWPEHASSGSGIYAGSSGASAIKIVPNRKSYMLVTTLPKVPGKRNTRTSMKRNAENEPSYTDDEQGEVDEDGFQTVFGVDKETFDNANGSDDEPLDDDGVYDDDEGGDDYINEVVYLDDDPMDYTYDEEFWENAFNMPDDQGDEVSRKRTYNETTDIRSHFYSRSNDYPTKRKSWQDMSNLLLTRHVYEITSTKFTNLVKKHKECSFKSEHTEYCCDYNIEYKFTPSKKFGYKLTTWYGSRKFGGRILGEMFCSIVMCRDSTDKGCGLNYHKIGEKDLSSMDFDSITITQTITQKKKDSSNDLSNYLPMPNTMSSAILPYDAKQFSFTSKMDKNKLVSTIKSTKKLSNLLSFGIYGRNFNYDK